MWSEVVVYWCDALKHAPQKLLFSSSKPVLLGLFSSLKTKRHTFRSFPYRIHTGDRPYKCAHPGCEKAFTQLSNLQVGDPVGEGGTKAFAAQPHVFVFPPQSHQRQHNKDKPYKCPNCYRAYSDSASLQIHLSAHAIKNAKAYSCSMCGRAYTSVSKHTRARSEEKAFCAHGDPRPSVLVAGDLSDEAHVQTHGRGALSEPPVTSEDRVPRHPHPHLPHLNPPAQLADRPDCQSSSWSPRGPAPGATHLHKADTSHQ